MEIFTELFVSELIGRTIIDRGGKRVGKVRDILINPEDAFPAIQGVIVRHEGRLQGIPWQDIFMLNRRFVTLKVTADEIHYEPISEEHYRTSMILDRQIVDMNGAKVVRVNDIKLAGEGSNAVHVVSIDVGLAGLLRRFFQGKRFGLRVVDRKVNPNLIRWDVLQPLPSDGGRLVLRVPDTLIKMHPADLAEIMENLTHKERREFFEQLTPDIAADALAEVNLDMQVSIIKGMDRERAADILEEMGQDEAVDILSEMTEEDSEQLLHLIEAEEATDLRGLLEYEEGTAGSMMTTDFLAFSADLTTDQVIQRLRELAPEAEYVYYLYVVDSTDSLCGVLSLRELIVSPPDRKIEEAMHTRVISVDANEDEKQVRRLFTKYSLLALPVVDKADKLAGIITVDDVLSLPINTRGLKM